MSHDFIRARRLPHVSALALAFCLALLLLAALGRVDPAHAQGDDAAGAHVIVQFDDTASIVRTVGFTPSVSGLELLTLSGLDVITSATEYGTSVCAIQGVGCPAEDCFCQCADGDTCRYWGYFNWGAAGWTAYDVGADASVITQTGAVEGWLWGEFGMAMTPITPTLAAARALAALSLAQQTSGIGSATNAVDTMLAIGANQQRAQAWTTPDGSPLSALLAGVTRYTRAPGISPAAAGKIALATVATDACWPLATRMPMDYYDPALQAYSEFAGINAWAMLGTLALGDAVPADAVATLKAAIQPDGGWEWMTGFGSDSNSTALAIQALVGAGEPVSATEVISGLVYLASTQNADGGFSYDANAPATRQSDTNSTAYVVQALRAAGETVDGPDWQTDAGNTPTDFLLAMQREDGLFVWQPGGDANTLATQQAIPALLGHTFPLMDVFAPTPGVDLCRGAYLPIALPGQSAP